MYQIPQNTIKALKYFINPKDPRKYLNGVHIYVHNGRLYAEATNGHVALRVEISNGVTYDCDFGVYSTDTIANGFDLDPVNKVLGLDGQPFIKNESDYYPPMYKVMPYAEVAGMADVTSRYRLSVEYQLLAIKTVELLTGIKNKLRVPMVWKSIDGDPKAARYEYRGFNFTIAIGTMYLPHWG